MQLYYLNAHNENDGLFDQEVSKHLRDVLRKKVGDPIRATNGAGKEFHGTISGLEKGKATMQIEQILEHEQQQEIHLAMAPTKNVSRMEWAIEKAVEIGVTRITPIICQRSEKKNVRMERLKRIVRAAALQSLKFNFPTLEEPIKLKELLKREAIAEKKYIAYCGEENLPMLMRIYPGKNSVLILVGPEGDFSADEVKQANSLGFETVTFGPQRLRTETAAVVAVNILQQKNLSV